MYLLNFSVSSFVNCLFLFFVHFYCVMDILLKFLNCFFLEILDVTLLSVNTVKDISPTLRCYLYLTLLTTFSYIIYLNKIKFTSGSSHKGTCQILFKNLLGVLLGPHWNYPLIYRYIMHLQNTESSIQAKWHIFTLFGMFLCPSAIFLNHNNVYVTLYNKKNTIYEYR